MKRRSSTAHALSAIGLVAFACGGGSSATTGGAANAAGGESTATAGGSGAPGGAGVDASGNGSSGNGSSGTAGSGLGGNSALLMGAGGTSAGSGSAGDIGGARGLGGALVSSSGGTFSATGGGTSSGAAGANAAPAGGAVAVGNGGSGGGVTAAGASGVAVPERVVVTGVRGVVTPAAEGSVKVHNASASAVSVTALTLTGTHAGLFQISSPPTLPALIAPNADLSLTIQLLTNSANLPSAPAQNDGATYLSANLNLALSAGAAQVGVYGLVLTTATHEATLGQILKTLGYPLNVGLAQNNANPNSGGTSTLAGVEAGTDEIAAPLFQKAGTGSVTLEAIARFSPKGPMPFGWYPKGAPTTRNTVGTMDQIADPQTSDKARMVTPPLSGALTFDPAAQTFGIWVYSDQLSQKYDTGGTMSNGDYDYSEDAPNSPPNVHRTKVYPLKNSAGTLVANTYLLAVEEAANGDYQDYVFVLGNAKVAP